MLFKQNSKMPERGPQSIVNTGQIPKNIFSKAFGLMCTAKAMCELFEAKKEITSKYVHATSRGHEAIQLAVGMQLKPWDFLSAYYRDDALLLGIGMQPYDLMLQLLAKRDDPFSGGRTYYSHPSLKRDDMPKIPHQSSATGMQAIPATGIAMGIKYREKVFGKPFLDDAAKNGETKTGNHSGNNSPITVCSLGDASITEGEVSEAFQMAVLKQLPILYLVQDNGWDISANAKEIRAMDASEFASGFKGLEVIKIDGSDFIKSFETVTEVFGMIRKERRPFLIHAKVPLLTHHTSGVRKEWYRDDLEEHSKRDPFPKLKKEMVTLGFDYKELEGIENSSAKKVEEDFSKALMAEDPRPSDLYTHIFAPTPITEEKGIREPKMVSTGNNVKEEKNFSRTEIQVSGGKTVMVDCALFAIRELMEKHKECLLYGQDVGRRLGGVFREAATLAEKFGDERVFNTPIQEAFIVGSTVGMSAAGLKPIVEIQFADYLWPGLNQLFTEVARSCYLTNGKYPVSMILRVPIGAYGSGGPYHSSSIESVICNIRGIKIAYPSNGADLKGLMKAAYYDPNPVVMLEHKGLYWSKIKGTEEAKTVEPDENYILPLGKARIISHSTEGMSGLSIITYGMGVYWAKNAAMKIKNSDFSGKAYLNNIEIVDLRTLVPLDEEMVFSSVKKNGKCLVVTEEPVQNSFAQALAGLIQEKCFEYLDAPVRVIGSGNTPAIPLNSTLEYELLPNAEKVATAITQLLNY